MATAMVLARSAETGVEPPKAMDDSPARMMPAKNWMFQIEEHPAWEVLSRINMTLRAEVPLAQFRVRDLLGLTAGQVFETASPDTEDVSIRVASVQLGWGEFEVIEQRIALRVTRLD